MVSVAGTGAVALLTRAQPCPSPALAAPSLPHVPAGACPRLPATPCVTAGTRVIACFQGVASPTPSQKCPVAALVLKATPTSVV